MAKHALIATSIFSATWWRATGARVLYTVLAALLPYALQVTSGEVTATFAVSVAALAGVAAFLTALANLPEIDTAGMPLWRAILMRAARTAGQTLAAGVAGFFLVQDVPWQAILVGTAGAVATTLLRTFLDVLPESAETTPTIAAEAAAEARAGESDLTRG